MAARLRPQAIGNFSCGNGFPKHAGTRFDAPRATKRHQEPGGQTCRGRHQEGEELQQNLAPKDHQGAPRARRPGTQRKAPGGGGAAAKPCTQEPQGRTRSTRHAEEGTRRGRSCSKTLHPITTMRHQEPGSNGSTGRHQEGRDFSKTFHLTTMDTPATQRGTLNPKGNHVGWYRGGSNADAPRAAR